MRRKLEWFNIQNTHTHTRFCILNFFIRTHFEDIKLSNVERGMIVLLLERQKLN